MRELPLEGRTKSPLLFFRSRSARGLEQGENTAGPCAETRDYRPGAIEAIVYRSCSTRNSHSHGVTTMASIRMVPEAEAVGDVRVIYEEIKKQFGIDFVPNLYKVMATNPAYLAANWNRVKAIMFAPGKLDRLTKEIIAVTVSAVQGCKY